MTGTRGSDKYGAASFSGYGYDDFMDNSRFAPSHAELKARGSGNDSVSRGSTNSVGGSMPAAGPGLVSGLGAGQGKYGTKYPDRERSLNCPQSSMSNKMPVQVVGGSQGSGHDTNNKRSITIDLTESSWERPSHSYDMSNTNKRQTREIAAVTAVTLREEGKWTVDENCHNSPYRPHSQSNLQQQQQQGSKPSLLSEDARRWARYANTYFLYFFHYSRSATLTQVISSRNRRIELNRLQALKKQEEYRCVRIMHRHSNRDVMLIYIYT